MESNAPVKRRRAGRIIFAAVLAFLIIAGSSFAVYWFSTAEERLYEEGMELMEAGRYEAALGVFEALPEYEPAAAQIPEAEYAIAAELMKAGEYQAAAERFSRLGIHRDSGQQAKICYYQLAVGYEQNGYYDSARRCFAQAGDYLDSAAQLKACCYRLADSARLAGDYEAAQDYFIQAGDHRDAATQAQRMLYTRGHRAFLEGDYETADSLFAQLEGSQEDYGYFHFRTLADAAEYLTQQRLNQSDRIELHVAEIDRKTYYETLQNLLPTQRFSPSYLAEDKLLSIGAIHYYPGENILYAWKNEDTSRLTPEELEVMELALEVVEQAKAETDTPHETERWLHDWLCSRVTYESPNMDIAYKEYIQLRELSCVGAMLDGTANCQGYADAFYLLGNLAGFEVEKIFGLTGGGHVWNSIVLDGTRYIVDVTFDDMSDQNVDGWRYTYFNTFWDPEVYDPYGEDLDAWYVTTENDLSQSYFSPTNRVFSDVEAAAEDLVSQWVVGKENWAYAVVENAWLSHAELEAAIRTALQQYFGGFYWNQWLEYYGDNTYLTVCWQ